MFCVECGKKLENEFKFCPYCGYKVEVQEAEEKEAADRIAAMELERIAYGVWYQYQRYNKRTIKALCLEGKCTYNEAAELLRTIEKGKPTSDVITKIFAKRREAEEREAADRIAAMELERIAYEVWNQYQRYDNRTIKALRSAGKCTYNEAVDLLMAIGKRKPTSDVAVKIFSERRKAEERQQRYQRASENVDQAMGDARRLAIENEILKRW